MNTWGEGRALVSPIRCDSEGFGLAVALDQDRVTVGSPAGHGQVLDVGAVKLFNAENNWGLNKKIFADEVKAYPNFGYSVALNRFFGIRWWKLYRGEMASSDR